MSTPAIQQPGNILVVDDEDLVRMMLADRLAFRGYQVTTARNGRAALAELQRQSFDLILLDIMMPEINGFQFLERLQAAGNQIPILVMSALDDMTSIVRCIELGAVDYLYKPIQSPLLWARLQATLQKKHLQDRDRAHMAELRLLYDIDRELNTTLDSREVAQLTLRWVTERVHAVAGLIGMVQEGHLIISAASGDALPAAERVALVELGLSHSFSGPMPPFVETIKGGAMSPAAAYRIFMPIQREESMQALVVLEMTTPCDPATLDFLSRLQSHAAIALHNAQLYADVQAANRAKSNFVAMVAHELKNPLQAIVSYAGLLSHGVGGDLTPKHEKMVDVIQDSAQRIHLLSQELDDISQVELGRFNLAFSAVSLYDVVDEVVQLLTQQCMTKQQHLVVDLAPNLPPVWADAARLGQILTNLLSNAIKYTPAQGRITIHAEQQQSPVPLFINIVIIDSGIGIAAGDQSKIFGEFYRAQDPRVQAETGTGLGLHITQKLIELHGGKIDVESIKNQGSTFRFALPTAVIDFPSVNATG